MNEKGYEALANAIVAQAVVDYVKALIVLDKTKGGRVHVEEEKRLEARCRLAEIRHFFKSKWYEKLCDTDRSKMLRLIARAYSDCRQTGDFKRLENRLRATS